MELTDLRYFWHAATVGSFLGAAEVAHVTPPAISKAIKRLERDLNVALFVRSTRRVVLTPGGETLRAHAERILRDVDELRLEVAGGSVEVRGDLHIAAMEVFSTQLLPDALARLVKKHPRVRPMAYEMIPERMEELLAQGRLDVGLTIGGGTRPEIHYQKLGHSEGVLVCGRGHPLYRRGRITPAQLATFPSVVPRFLGAEHLPPLDQFLDLPRHVGATIELLQMGVSLALSGQFLAYFPQITIAAQLRNGSLKALRGLPRGRPFDLRALTRVGVRPRPAASQLIETLAARLAKS
ncbi:MAG: LysR family transcriptional regulator [Deltaproteobacteria bacterium]|nr:LysR family transcriptional regulator [Deltaproteobacteria bacterium]